MACSLLSKLQLEPHVILEKARNVQFRWIQCVYDVTIPFLGVLRLLKRSLWDHVFESCGMLLLQTHIGEH